MERAHRNLAGKSTQDCINTVVDGCRKLPTMKGVFFEVKVPIKKELFAVIPRNKLEPRWFGVNQNGIFCMEKDSGEVSEGLLACESCNS